MATPPVSRLFFLLASTGCLLALGSCGPPAKPQSHKDMAGGETPDSPREETAPKPEPPAEDKEPAPAAAPAPAPDREITSADRDALAAFGEAFATAMSGGNDDAIRTSFNADAFLTIGLGNAAEEVDPQKVKDLKIGFLRAVRKKPGGILWATFERPWKMLRVREMDGDWGVLCRVAADGVLSYLELIPRLNDQEEFEIVDVYSFGTGERLSETFGRLHIPKLSEEESNPDDAGLIAFSDAVQAGNFEEALEQYRMLPPEIRGTRSALLMVLGVATKLMASGSADAEKVYRDGVEEFQKKFGDDAPAFLLTRIDYHLFREEFDAANKAIDQLDEAVGGDPYLDYIRASVLLGQGEIKEALPLAEKARDSNPELEDPCWGVVNIQLELKNNEAVAEGLDRLAQKFGYEFELEQDPAYEAFLASPEGKAWVARQAAPTASEN